MNEEGGGKDRSQNIVAAFFRDEPRLLVQPHIDSYDDFIDHALPDIIRQHNPITISSRFDGETMPLSTCLLYVGGKIVPSITCKPPRSVETLLSPNEARLRLLTYALSVYVDIDVEFVEWLDDDDDTVLQEPEYAKILAPPETPSAKRNDDDDEGIIVRRRHVAFDDDDTLSVEEMVRKRVHDELVKNSAEKRKALENMMTTTTATHEPKNRIQRTYQTTLKNVFLGEIPLLVQSRRCLLHDLTAEMRVGLGECRHDVGGYFIIDGKERAASLQVRAPPSLTRVHVDSEKRVFMTLVPEEEELPPITLPLFTVFRALGVESDKAIIEYIVLDLDRNDDMVDFLAESVYHSERIHTQKDALDALFCGCNNNDDAGKRMIETMLKNTNPYPLGHSVYECLSEFLRKSSSQTAERRVVASGTLLEDWFRQDWKTRVQNMQCHFQTVLSQHHHYESNLYALVMDHHVDALQQNTGNMLDLLSHFTDLNRSSFIATIHQLRQTDISGVDALFGYVDPLDHSLSLAASVSRAVSSSALLEWLKKHWNMEPLDHFHPVFLADLTKVFVNGEWVGVVDEPLRKVQFFRTWRHNGLMSPHVSCTFVYEENRINLWCDAGRLLRPLFYKGSNRKDGADDAAPWLNYLTGFHSKKDKEKEKEKWDPLRIYSSLADLYDTTETNPNKLARFDKEKSAVELVDEYESSMSWIAAPNGTHSEIHPALFLGWTSHHVAFIEHQPADDIRRTLSFLMGGLRKITSFPHSNIFMRVDESATVLVSGQMPLVKSQIPLQSESALTFGHNIVVAVMSTAGGCWINRGSVQRGLFAGIELHANQAGGGGDKPMRDSMICTTTKDDAPLIWHPSSSWIQQDEKNIMTRGGFGPESAQVISESDMPFLADGSRPDVVLSSEKVALLYELFAGKFAAVLGGHGDSTPFQNSVFRSLGGMGSVLTAMGYHSSGNAILYDGMSGQQNEVEVFVGVALAMNVLSSPETAGRRKGPRDHLTRQPSVGGVALKELDVLALLGHGSAATTQDALMTRGDECDLAVCNKSGMTAIVNPARRVFFSPAVDGPPQFTNDEAPRVDFVSTDAGRDFSVVRVPYAFKLMVQELQAAGIQLRLATDDQINQSGWRHSLQSAVPSPAESSKKLLRKKRDDVRKGGTTFQNVMYLLDQKEQLDGGGGGKKKKPESDIMIKKEDEEKQCSPELLDDVIDLDDDTKNKKEPEEKEKDDTESRHFDVGHRVCMRGVTDGFPERPWTIVRMGDAFLTVRALDASDLPIKDQIKVVARTDIMHESDIVHFLEQQQQHQQQPWSQWPQQGSAPPPMVLNIAPKFVNGTDNSQEIAAPTPDGGVVPFAEIARSNAMARFARPAADSSSSMPSIFNPAAAAGESTFKNDDIDFSKGLIIVKKS